MVLILHSYCIKKIEQNIGNSDIKKNTVDYSKNVTLKIGSNRQKNHKN